MSLARKLLAATGAGALSLTMVATAAPAGAAPIPAGAFADAKGVIVDLVALTALPLPGPLAGTPIDPNTFSTASQSCPPQVAEPSTDELLNVPADPVVTAGAVTTMAGANCAVPSAVASAQTVGVTALSAAVAGGLVTADVIRAQANSDCLTPPNAKGSLFQNLKVNGTTILPDPAPNTVIEIPGVAKVIINEQHPTADGRGIVVNGVHIIGESPVLRGDLVISHAVSGVVCPNGKGSEIGPGLTKPDITFAKKATPSTAKPGATVTYTATVTNTSADSCDVISFIDHLAPGFTPVSTSGAFGTAFDTPAPKRADGGIDVVFHPEPDAVTLAQGKSVTQQIVVKLADDIAPGTYFDTLEIFCNANGNFASGPLAPVTVPAPAAPAPPKAVPEQLPRTGGSELLVGGALLLLLGAAGARRFTTR